MKTITKEQFRKTLMNRMTAEYQDDHRYMDTLTMVLYDDLSQLENDKNIKVQSIPDNTQVNFNLKGVGKWTGENKHVIETLFHGKQGDESIECKVDTLATFSELGLKTGEYYDLEFENGYRLQGICGYHLEVIPVGVFKPGDIVTLNTLGMETDLAYLLETTEEEIMDIFKKEAEVLCLATYSELGNKDGEYYDLDIKGLMGEYHIPGLSGYHIELKK